MAVKDLLAAESVSAREEEDPAAALAKSREWRCSEALAAAMARAEESKGVGNRTPRHSNSIYRGEGIVGSVMPRNPVTPRSGRRNRRAIERTAVME